MATTYMHRTPVGSGSGTTFTISFWMKRGLLSSGNQTPFISHEDGSNYVWCLFNSSDALQFKGYKAGPATFNLETTRVFRDTAAWMHICLTFDSTESVEADRIKIYVNGVKETSFVTETYPAEDNTMIINDTDAANVVGVGYSGASYVYAANHWSGSLSHFHFIDGTAYQASTFGGTDATSGIWKIKTGPSVTYGTNGFFLKMEDRTNLDLDSGTNTFTFTTSGTPTATYDNPSNNFATFNSLNQPTTPKCVYSNGNTTVVTQDASAKYFGGTSTLGMEAGKWYCEYKASSLASNGMVGVMGYSGEQARLNDQTGDQTTGYAYLDTGDKKNDGSTGSYGNSYTTSNVIGVAIDLDNLKIYFSKDNTWQDSGDPTSGATGTGAAYTVLAPSATQEGYYTFSCSDNTTGSSTWDVNFGNGYFGTTAVTSAEADGAGQGAFEFAPPTGYYALCTKNIKAYGG